MFEQHMFAVHTRQYLQFKTDTNYWMYVCCWIYSWQYLYLLDVFDAVFKYQGFS